MKLVIESVPNPDSIVSNNVKFTALDLLQFNKLDHIEEQGEDNLTDSDDDIPLSVIKERHYQKSLTAKLRWLQNNKVFINFIGRNDVNEVLIKKILPGSNCSIVMFRCKNKSLPKLHQVWLNNLEFSLEFEGLKGYLGDANFKVCNVLFID